MSINEKKSTFAFIWHGFFLALTMAMLDLNTVFPTLINTLTSSKYIFGALYSIMLGIPLIFNLIFSHFLRSRPYKKRYLLIGIYIRSLSFFGMGIFTYYFSELYPQLVIASFLFVFLFSISAGFAGLSYSDLMAKTIDNKRRTTLYTIKQFFGSTSSLLGGFIIARIFQLNIVFPDNYALSLTIGFIGLVVASLGFYLVKEPPSILKEEKETFLSYIKQIPHIIKTDTSFRYYFIVENLSSFSVMILPFYILYAKELLHVSNDYIGIYLIIQISGTILSNILWGFIGKKLSAKAIVRLCITLGAINPIIALFTAQVSPIMFGIVFFIMGFTISGRRIGFEPTLLDIAPSTHRIEYLGIRGTLNVSIIILPLLGAFFIETLGYTFTFVLVTTVMILAVILLSKVKPEQLNEYCIKTP